MTNFISIEHAASRQLLKLKRLTLQESISQALKQEAYDDSGIDNTWVSNLEKEAPGIITAYSGDHNFTTATPEENRRVVMEAVNSGTALKAGIVAAVILLIFKVYRVLTNNKEFNMGGSGGRGTSSYNAQQLEEVRAKGKQALEELEKAKEVINQVKSNPLNREDDSPVYKAVEQMNKAAAGNVPADEQKTNKNPLDEAVNLKFEFLTRVFHLLPFYFITSSDEAFETALTFYELLVNFNTGKMSKVFDFRVFITSMLNMVEDLSSMDLIQMSDNLVSPKYQDVWITICQGIFTEFGKLVPEIQQAASTLQGAKLPEYVEALQKTVKPFTAMASEMMAPNTESLTSPDGETFGIFTDDELYKQAIAYFESSGQTTTGSIFSRIEKIGSANEHFKEFVTLYEREFESSDGSGAMQQIYSRLDQIIARIKESGELEPDAKSVMMAHITSYKSLFDIVITQLLKTLFNFRTSADKANVMLKRMNSDLDMMLKKIVASIDTVKKNEGA